MNPFTTPALPPIAALLALALVALPCRAEKADRGRPMVVEADKPGTLDLQRQVVVFNGNVAVVQGTMVIRAERVELREMTDGFRAATAIGSATNLASYRQKRDGIDELVEGQAERIDFDGRADTLRFVGNGMVRRLRGSIVADEITGSVIVWDNATEVFTVQGGAASPTNPGGRVRAVLSPRLEAVASAASGASGASAAPLKPSRSLAEPK